jgi:hypothetical protein
VHYLSSNRKGLFDLLKNSNGVGNEQLLLESKLDKNSTGFSLMGGYFLYTTTDPNTRRHGLCRSRREAVSFLQEGFNEINGRFPDGHWVTYQSDESRRFEIIRRRSRAAAASAKSPSLAAAAMAERDFLFNAG